MNRGMRGRGGFAYDTKWIEEFTICVHTRGVTALVGFALMAKNVGNYLTAVK